MSAAFDTAIQLQDVDYRYRSSDAVLSGSTLRISRGEFIAVLGADGSGKSTLAGLLNGLLLPSSGVVLINGMDTRNESLRWEIRRTVGMLFQQVDDQIVGTTVAEDVAFGPENLGWSSETIQDSVRNALLAVDMADFADVAPHLLSSSQKVKVALAAVLAMQPASIVVDDAISGLEPVERSEIIQLLHRLNRERGLTVMVVTGQIQGLNRADRVFKLLAGRIVMEAAPEPGGQAC